MTPNPLPAPPRQPKKGMSGVAIALIVVAAGFCFVLPVVGILAAIAIPNFIKFQSRSKQAECKTYLKAMYTAERVALTEHDAFSTDAQAIGFSPEPNHRYSYFLGDGVSLLADNPQVKDAAQHEAQLARSGILVGVEGTCPECTFTGACVGNIDGDDTFDAWTVSTADRTAPDGTTIPAGMPYNDVNDLME